MADRPKHLLVGDPILWTIVIIDPDGEPLDALAVPVITVRKNGTLIADVGTAVRRTTGVYDCSYLPSVVPTQGDQFTLEEFIQVNPGQGVTSHKNAWEFIVNVEERTGGGIREVQCTVQTDGGSPVGGVLVDALDNLGNELGIQAPTDTLGVARFNLNDGDYQFLAASVPGYTAPVPVPYTVDANNLLPVIVLYALTTDPTDPNAIDMSGIKRVKTKHMEIEAFDPRVVQEARDKEQNSLPTFCSVPMCKGVYCPPKKGSCGC